MSTAPKIHLDIPDAPGAEPSAGDEVRVEPALEVRPSVHEQIIWRTCDALGVPRWTAVAEIERAIRSLRAGDAPAPGPEIVFPHAARGIVDSTAVAELAHAGVQLVTSAEMAGLREERAARERAERELADARKAIEAQRVASRRLLARAEAAEGERDRLQSEIDDVTAALDSEFRADEDHPAPEMARRVVLRIVEFREYERRVAEAAGLDGDRADEWGEVLEAIDALRERDALVALLDGMRLATETQYDGEVATHVEHETDAQVIERLVGCYRPTADADMDALREQLETLTRERNEISETLGMEQHERSVAEDEAAEVERLRAEVARLTERVSFWELSAEPRRRAREERGT